MFSKLNIPRKNWLRGTFSCLLEFDHFRAARKQCCVGLMCTQLGIPDAYLTARTGLLKTEYVDNDVRPLVQERAPEVIAGFERQYSGLTVEGIMLYRKNDTIENSLYIINDKSAISDSVRESELTMLFGLIGIAVNFFDEEINFGV